MPGTRALLLFGLLDAGLALVLDVYVHYPEVNSAFDKCGFQFKLATPFGDQENPPPVNRSSANLFNISLEIPDEHLYSQISLGVMATLDGNKIGGADCQAVCPRLGPQGLLVQNGPYFKTEPLPPKSEAHLWPSFCLQTPSFHTVNSSFTSKTLGRVVTLQARVPATIVENPLPRPAGSMPPIMIRFNSEWYWPYAQEEYMVWHDLMLHGVMQPIVVAEMYLEGIDWQEWTNQPIFTTQDLKQQCGVCSAELQFICDAWVRGYNGYAGGNHHFGQAPAFYDELYEIGLPGVLHNLPDISGSRAQLRVGAWGYCIGGLAAYNALVVKPGRFNIGYLGSPAMDFDCGAPFESVGNLTWNSTGTGPRTKVYIDSGAAEGPLMNTQTLLLLRRLQANGGVEGRDVFYERAEFGTHQGRGLLRRALRGLLVLFGTGNAGQPAYTPALPASAVAGGAAHVPAGPAKLAASAGGGQVPLPAAAVPTAVAAAACAVAAAACTAAAFVLGRRSAAAAGGAEAGRRLLLAP